ncbi:hypothetical protein ACFZB9_21170 [Kitasatospora sp. NPDC008050]|uniref:hypothetical protein n=1 Tax=Kitasatospora sp. NPDC008050 TaxID=3364021 RepID=UPI0036EA3DF6
MTPDGGTRIGRVDGQTHTGSGDQYTNNYWFVDSAGRLRRRGRPYGVTLDDRRWLLGRFVAPGGYGAASDQLGEPGSVVLLDGAPGSGRRTAAMMLLHEVTGEDGRFEVLTAGDTDQEALEDDLDAEPGDGFLFDLSACDEQGYGAALRGLARYREVVSRVGARLVAVLPNRLEHLLLPELLPLVCPINRPEGRRVFQRHLRAQKIAVPPAELEIPALIARFDTDPLHQLATLARQIKEASRSGQAGDGFAQWLARAAKVSAKQVADAVAKLESPERVLLLAAAMLSGAPADAVFEAANRLTRQLKQEEPVGVGLARDGLIKRLDQSGVTVDRAGLVRFDTLGYDEVVRSHFWVNYPDLRGDFHTWVRECVDSPSSRAAVSVDLGPAERRKVVERLAEQCLATRRPEDIWQLVDTWTRPPHDGLLVPEAAQVLERGLTDESFAGQFREQMRGRAKGKEALPVPLARVFTGLCVNVLARTHPDQAVVRLHHLARRPGGVEVDEARRALRELAGSERRLRRLLLRRVLRGLGRSTPAREDLELFEWLADPDWLLGEPLVLATAVPGWRTVMRDPAYPWTQLAHRWLDAATRRPADADQLLGVLVAAATGEGAVLDRLYLLACGWGGPTGHTPRAAVAARLRQRIDRVQGLRPFGGAGAVPNQSAHRQNKEAE